MNKERVKAIVISGYGINCEKETAHACAMAGADAKIVHAQQMFDTSFPWHESQLILFPGGFSFGDELGAGKAFANRLSYHAMQLRDRLNEFVMRGNCIMGICNGFQLLVKLGLLPGDDFNQTLSLVSNASSRFECRWVHHRVCASHCVFTRGIDSLYLPIRHAEGQLVGASSRIAELFGQQQVVLQYADEKGQPAQLFPDNPNGSMEAIGGICDPTGRIFGMMAHPEAALYATNDPRWTRLKESRGAVSLPEHGPGLAVFKSVVNFLEGSA